MCNNSLESGTVRASVQKHVAVWDPPMDTKALLCAVRVIVVGQFIQLVYLCVCLCTRFLSSNNTFVLKDAAKDKDHRLHILTTY